MHNGARLCLPHEYLDGYWSSPPMLHYHTGPASMKPRQFLRAQLNDSARWQPSVKCEMPARGSSTRALRMLARRNVSIVFSGNSIMRHVFFRFASFLRGEEDEFSQDAREREKALCPKELDASAGGGAGKYRKPFCKSGCCGACSCAHEVATATAGRVGLFFVWQQEWYDARMRRVWDALLTSPQLQRRQVYLVMNAGLVNAREPSLNCILNYQFPLLRDYLLRGLPVVTAPPLHLPWSLPPPPPSHAPPPSRAHHTKRAQGGTAANETDAAGAPTAERLPPRVHVVYLASPPTQHEEAAAWMGAQDGMLQSLFEGMPPSHRPLWFDARPALRDWVDYIDVNHFGGRAANVVVDGLIHLAVHWDALYGVGGRGWRRQRRATRPLNKYDRVAPSSDAFLQGIHAQLDTSVSPPPAHSKHEPCFRL